MQPASKDCLRFQQLLMIQHCSCLVVRLILMIMIRDQRDHVKIDSGKLCTPNIVNEKGWPHRTAMIIIYYVSKMNRSR